jgi:murein DD-endopeptidase MepM/ murein hydrolase activator NlpD
MKKILCAAAVFLCLLALPLLSYQWPVEKPVVVETFAQSYFGEFYRGISIAGKDESVRPVEKGELVYYSNGDGAGVPSVLGGFAVIQHEENLRSVYGHLALDDELASGRKTFFEAADRLGTIGDSGFTQAPQLFLVIHDMTLEQMVNPYLVLPPLEEKVRPTIRNVTLHSGTTEIPLPAPGGVSAGLWDVFADIFDEVSLRYFRPMAAYRVSVYINGQETFLLAFDAIKEKDGILRVYPSKDLSWQQVYAEGWRMRLGSVQLKRGMANLEIIVRDFSGNERSQSFQFRVR